MVFNNYSFMTFDHTVHLKLPLIAQISLCSMPCQSSLISLKHWLFTLCCVASFTMDLNRKTSVLSGSLKLSDNLLVATVHDLFSLALALCTKYEPPIRSVTTIRDHIITSTPNCGHLRYDRRSLFHSLSAL